MGVGALAVGLGVGASSLAGASGTQQGANSGHHATHAKLHRIAEIEAIAETGTLPAKFSCDRASVDQAKITKLTSRLDTRIATLNTNLSTATAAGETLKVQVLTDRIAQMTTLRGDLVTVSGLITSRCG